MTTDEPNRFRKVQLGLIIIVSILGLGLLFIMGHIADHIYDNRVCNNEFKNIQDRYIPHMTFTTDSFDDFNFGKDVKCTIYFYEKGYGGYLSNVKFLSGRLTIEYINDAEYWKNYGE